MVVRPESAKDVVKIVKIAVKYKMPATPSLGGSSLKGNCRAVRTTLSLLVPYDCLMLSCYWQHLAGGICIDMSGTDKILEIHGTALAYICSYTG